MPGSSTAVPEDGGTAGDEDSGNRIQRALPTAEFLAELRLAFDRLGPQGSARWNFSSAFTQLEKRFSGADDDPAEGRRANGSTDESVSAAPPPPQRVLRKAADPIVSRLQPWIEARAADAAEEAAGRALTEGLGRIEEGFDATVEAFRFLAARVEVLENAAARRHDPVDGSAWLLDPPSLESWAAPVAEFIDGSTSTGPVLHAECGAGELAVELVASGFEVWGSEPRGAVAWAAAERGLAVHVGGTAERLGSIGSGALGALVLSGIVERVDLAELVDLLALAGDRLTPGGALIVLSSHPGMVATGWSAVAVDLLPGRPLHPETWELLLERAGYSDAGPLSAPTKGERSHDTYGVGGFRAR